MVGVPRSKGCLLCVKRRVKCDEVRPWCGNCARYGTECPGYDRPVKFVTGKHRIRGHRPSGGEPDRDVDPGPARNSAGSYSEAPSFSVVPQRPRVVAELVLAESPSSPSPAQRAKMVALHNAIFADLGVDRALFICTMIDSLYTTSMRKELVIFAPWFRHVPQHLGSKITLDSAVSAFTLHVMGKAGDDATLLGESRFLYGRSLVALQAALNHPVEWKSSHTLCAAMLLCLFELFAGTVNAGSWMKHSAGVCWLIQQRGPLAHVDPWDQDMFSSFRSIIIMHTMFSGQDCFLEKKEWQKTQERISRGFGSQVRDGWRRDLADSFIMNLAKMPGILRLGEALRTTHRHGQPIDESIARQVTERAVKLRKDFLDWHKVLERTIPGPVEIPSQDPGSPFDVVYRYENVWFGSLYMGYWATMLILQECLVQANYPQDFRVDNKKLAGHVNRSLETVVVGVLGPYRIGYAVRVAYEFADLRTQAWIRSLLGRHEKLYAGISPKGLSVPENVYTAMNDRDQIEEGRGLV